MTRNRPETSLIFKAAVSRMSNDEQREFAGSVNHQFLICVKNPVLSGEDNMLVVSSVEHTRFCVFADKLYATRRSAFTAQSELTFFRSRFRRESKARPQPVDVVLTAGITGELKL